MTGLFGGVPRRPRWARSCAPSPGGMSGRPEKAQRLFLAELARRSPVLPGKDVMAFVDIDSMQKRVYGHKKQGAAFGHTKIQGKSVLVRGLNALAAAVSTPLAAPVIAATRLRGGNANSARGAASFAAESVSAARAAGCTGKIVVRMDSAYYAATVIAAIRRAGRSSPSPPRWTARSAPPSAPSRRPHGLPSSTRRRSGMRSRTAGSPMPRSPRFPTRRSRPGRGRPSPPGCWCAGSGT